MADAKWHPATGDFGVFGDYGPGKEGSRADRAAKRAVSSLQEQYDLVKGREGNIDEYYNLLESLSSKEYDTRERGVDLARTELVQQGKGLDLQRAGIDLEKEGMGRKETSALDNFLTGI